MPAPGPDDGVLPADWALPALDATNRAWFTTGTLALQRCTGCHVLQHPPEEVCHVCGSQTFDSHVVAPAGTVHSYTVVHHAVHTALEPYVPYALVLVSLDEEPDVRVVGNLLDVPVDEVAIGMAVEAVWARRVAGDGEELLLPQWRRAGTAAPDA